METELIYIFADIKKEYLNIGVHCLKKKKKD